MSQVDPTQSRDNRTEPSVVNVGEHLELLTTHRSIVIANACASLGWPVLPWRYDGDLKRPRIRGWSNGEASTDPEQLAAWFNGWRYRDCHAGVLTGPRSGLLVVDLDVSGAANGIASLRQLEREHGEQLPTGFQVATPSGGVHLYYRYPEGVEVPTTANTRLGIDVRAAVNGFVVAPDTWTERGLYAPKTGDLFELPAWFVEWACAQQAERFNDRDSGQGNPASVSGWVEAAKDQPSGRWENQHDFLVSAVCSALARDVSRDAAKEFAWEVVQQFEELTPDQPWTQQQSDAQVDYEYGRNPPGTSHEALPPPLAWRPAQVVTESVGNVVQFPSGDPTVTATLEVREGERNTAYYNGRDFAEFAAGRLAWTAQAGWLTWCGTHWRSDEKLENKRLVDEFTNQLSQRYATAGHEEQNLLHGRIRSLESTQGRNSCLDFAAPYLSKLLTDFDANPWLLNVGNGTLDLVTGQLRGHDPTDLITRFIPTAYDPAARDSEWDRVVGAALGDQEKLEVFWRFMGSCLTGVARDKAFLVPTGPRDTGKSTVVEPFVRLLGDVADGGYASVWDPQVVQRRSQVNRAEASHKVRAARLVVIGELEKGSRFDDSFVKRLTGGDTVNAKALYKGSYSYRPGFKLVMPTNYVPGSTDRALHVRLKPLPFEHVVTVKDPGVKEYLESEACRAALLAFAVSGCAAWQQHGLGKMPWLDEWLRQYEADSNPTVAFLEECTEALVVSDPVTAEQWGRMVQVEGLWLAYQSWASEHTRHPLKKSQFAQALRELGWQSSKVEARAASDTPNYRKTVWSSLAMKSVMDL